MGYFNGHKVGSVIRPPLGLSTKTITLNQPGWTLARDNGCDGFVGVYAEPIDVPTETLDYIAGNDSVTTLFVPDGVARIRGNFQCFPNITRVIIANQSTVLDIASNAWTGTQVSEIIVPNVFLDYYKAKFPAWASILTTWVAQNEFTIPYVGETTLTSEYVGQVVSVLGENRKIVTKVIVPADFTEYQEGSIQRIIDEFPNMDNLVIPFEAGDMSFDISNDNITSIDGFVFTTAIEDAATKIEQAFNADYSSMSMGEFATFVKGLHFAPKVNYTQAGYTLYIPFSSKIYYFGAYIINTRNASYNALFQSNQDILYVTNLIKSWSGASTQNMQMGYTFYNCQSLKVVDLQCADVLASDSFIVANCYALESIKLHGFVFDLSVSSSNLLTRQAIIDLIDSLGTPTSSKTVSLGSTNLAKLNPADIQLAYDKNWALNPTPAPFSLSLDGVTYSCDYGMTWQQWVASAYNTDAYQITDGIVYDSTGTKVIQESNGSIAMSGKLVRGGATYNVIPEPTFVTATIPYDGDSQLTVQAVRDYADTLADKNLVTKVVVPADFTIYESGALTKAKDEFINLYEIEVVAEQNLTKDEMSTFMQSAKWPYKVVLTNTSVTSPFDNHSGFYIGPDVVDFTMKSYTAGYNNAGQYPFDGINLKRFVLTGTFSGNTRYGKLFAATLDSSIVTNGTPNIEYVDLGTNENTGQPWICHFDSPIIFGPVAGKEYSYRVKNLQSDMNFTVNNDHDSLVYIIDNLYDYSGGTTHTLKLGSTNLAKLSSAEIAVATAKNWSVTA